MNLAPWTDQLRRPGAILAAAVIAWGLMPLGGNAAPACAPASPGGEWRSYGHDLANSRTQDQPTTVGAGDLSTLHPVWKVASGAGGSFNSTPIVADGCVFAGNAGGVVFAFNADTGAVVWSRQLPMGPTGLGGLVVGAPSVEAGRVIYLVNVLGAPYAVAYDEFTGTQLWKQTLDSLPDAYANSGTVVWQGLVFAGFAGYEYHPAARGGYTILDAATGQVLVHQYTISDADHAYGYRGASIWSTAAVDTSSGFAYVGTGNPGGHAPNSQATLEHPNANSILQVDLNRLSSTFGQITGHYHGTRDQYVSGLDNQPACTMLGGTEYGVGGDGGAWSVTCAQLDLDFGASPNLFTDASGARLVGDLQKSGVYHAAQRDTMAPAWQAIVGAPCFVCNAASTAYDGRSVIGVGTPGSVMFGLGGDGSSHWVAPLGDGAHYQSTSVANGVAYTIDLYGSLVAVDSATGLPLLRRPLGLDTGKSAADLGSGGVAVARNTVYVAQGGFILAYQP